MYNVYDFFTQYGVNFKDRSVLDYGCDWGRLLTQYKTPVQDYQYTGFDIRKDIIELNRNKFNNQHWIYQNLHNPAYNPSGNETLKLECKYDLIVSFSIFTHTSYEEFNNAITYFYDKLNAGGELFLTFLAKNNNVVLDKLYHKRVVKFGGCDTFIDTDTFYYVVNNKLTLEFPEKCNLILSIYNNDMISKYGNIIKNKFQNILHIKK